MEVQIVWNLAFWGWVLAPMLSCSGIFAAENPSPVIGEADRPAIASLCRRESHKFLLTSMWVVCCAACTCPAPINTQSLGTLSKWFRQANVWPSYVTSGCLPRDMYTPMFIAALFIVERKWNQPNCPSTDDWIMKICYIYKRVVQLYYIIYSAIKKNEITKFIGKMNRLTI